MAAGSRGLRFAQAFGFRYSIDAFAAAFAAEAEFAIAAEADAGIEQIGRIDPDDAGLQFRRDIKRQADGLAPHAGGKAIARVVGEHHRLIGRAERHRQAVLSAARGDCPNGNSRRCRRRGGAWAAGEGNRKGLWRSAAGANPTGDGASRPNPLLPCRGNLSARGRSVRRRIGYSARGFAHGERSMMIHARRCATSSRSRLVVGALNGGILLTFIISKTSAALVSWPGPPPTTASARWIQVPLMQISRA